jgi:hypothetical protein
MTDLRYHGFVGPKRILVAVLLLSLALLIAILALAMPVGTIRPILLAAAGFDAFLGIVFLLFGVPNNRRGF